jgi:hypothetical protein
MKPANLLKLVVQSLIVRSATGLIVLGTVLGNSALALDESSIPAVGEVTFLLGKAYIERADGARESIKVGTLVNESDRIETGTNGHVHVRFVDQALVSVRPASELEVLRYQYDAQSPENSIVKFNLVEGTTRAISGKAAKAARENFRMDTPIAAIGVRGTDFIVSSNYSGVSAKVEEGAISIAVYSSECSSAAFGPCSLNALELTGGANQIVQIDANTNEALLLSLSAPALPEGPVQLAADSPGAAPAQTKTKDEGLYTDSVTSKTVTRALVARNLVPTTPSQPPQGALPEFTPDNKVSAAALTNSQLVWGRWYETSSERERITIPWSKELADTRASTIGHKLYGLYRIQPNGEDVQRGLGELGFNLNQAQVVISANGQSDLMNVTGGMLNIDFSNNLYSTSLQMNHAATGNVQFSDSGRIESNGIFNSYTRDGAGFLTGAVSVDGKEAGYAFEQILQFGIIEGLTLWGVKP